MSEYQENDLYKPPKAELRSNLQDEFAIPAFYVVSGRKFLILAVGTLGMYFLYWFYQHWKNQKLLLKEKMLPVMRCIFSIFFVHSLFHRIQGELDTKNKTYSWNPGVMATLYVVLSILQYVLGIMDQGEETTVLTLFNWLMLIPTIFVVYIAQKAANLACDDPMGLSNHRLTWANYLWLLLGVLLWVGILFSIFWLFFGDPVEMML